jgi:DsbC/DsbD-like thiol-disulfide interchange protein
VLLFLPTWGLPEKMNTSKKSKAFSMKSRRATLLLLAASCGWAQQQRLAVKPPEQMTIQRNSAATQKLNVTVQPGSHVNSDKPKDEYLIPLKLEWESGPVSAESVSYPQPEQMKVGSEMLSVFTGSFVLSTTFRASKDAPAGAASLTGKLHYQACNDQMCFRPSTLIVHLPVVVR